MHKSGMKLFYSTASPYARKVVVAAREAGVIDQIEIISTNASPVDRNGDIVAANPTGKIPTLVLDDGTAIFDSRVICEYFASLGDGAALYPSNADQNITAQTLHALGDGILDAALLARYENFMRPEELRWDAWTKGQQDKIHSSLDYLESGQIDFLNGPMTIGHIAIACAISYLEFRQIIEDWRDGHPNLANWYDGFSKREHMKATEPS